MAMPHAGPSINHRRLLVDFGCHDLDGSTIPKLTSEFWLTSTARRWYIVPNVIREKASGFSSAGAAGANSGQSISLALQERIEAGDYRPGTRLPAERALAQEFGVDRSVVRAALLRLEEKSLIVREPGRRPWVRPDARRGAVSLSEQARRPALRTIAAVIPQHPVYQASAALLYGINLALRSEEEPFRLVVFDTHGDSDAENVLLEKRALDAVEQDRIDGVILWHRGGAETLPQLARLQDLGIALVFVDRFPSEMSADFVGVDNQASAAEAVQYLQKLGHRRIAHLTTTEQTSAVVQRQVGYRDALRAAGTTPRPEWIYQAAEVMSPDLAPAVRQFFGSPEPPTALFAMNDALAHLFIAAAEAAGHRVPADLSVIGFDDLERYSPRPALLTTLHQPFDRIGSRAVQLLARRLKSPEGFALPRQHVLLPTPLVVRSTCQPMGKEV
jgi:DNA-binding LacI/PurR family transcriptional regulator